MTTDDNSSLDFLCLPCKVKFPGIQRIAEGAYIDDEWEEDSADSVRNLHDFLHSDITAPLSESKLEERVTVVRMMLDDLNEYRQAFLKEIEDGILLCDHD